MRAFIMFGVLSVHTTDFYLSLTNRASASFYAIGALVTSLHFTRESFMFITGLVLFVTYGQRQLDVRSFWKKRLTLIVIPYLAWTGVYIIFNGIAQPTAHYWSAPSLLKNIQHSTFTGSQFFLYYLFVTMQFYLVFPVLLKWLRKMRRYHLHVLLCSLLLQFAITAVCKFVVPYTDPRLLPPVISNIVRYHNEFVFTYQFWFIAGALAAFHYDKFSELMRRHARKLFLLLVGAVFAVWGHYLLDRLVLHESEGLATLVLQPLMVPYSLLVTLNLWLAARRWNERRTLVKLARFNQFVELGSATSFGMFLVQPIPLVLAEKLIRELRVHGDAIWLHDMLWPTCIVIVYAFGAAATYWMAKTPRLRYLVGRSTPIPRPSRIPEEGTVVAEGLVNPVVSST